MGGGGPGAGGGGGGERSRAWIWGKGGRRAAACRPSCLWMGSDRTASLHSPMAIDRARVGGRGVGGK